MIPVGAIVGGILAARGRGGQANDPLVASVALRTLVSIIVLPLATALCVRVPLAGAPGVVLVLALLFPTFTLLRILVPLGLARAAYRFARISPPVRSSHEIRGAAVFYGALAALRARTLDPATLAWLDARLATEVTVRGTSVAAAGFLAAAHGKPESARLLLAGVEGLDWRMAPRVVRREARAWLIADAARRGDWRLVASLGRGRGSFMRWPWSMGAIAARLIGDPRAPSNAALRLAWLVAPHRRASWPILQRALQTPHALVVEKREANDGPSLEPLSAALRAHAACLRSPSSTTLGAAARGWDTARDAQATRALIARRAMALEATSSADAVHARLFDAVETELAAHVAYANATTIAASPTLTSAAHRARQRDLDEIDAIAKTLSRRTTQKIPLHAFEEWMEWSTLRRLCDRTLQGAHTHLRRTLFTSIYSASCNYAVWMFNVRGEKLLANTIFRWLLEEARAVADEPATKLLTKNVASGYGP